MATQDVMDIVRQTFTDFLKEIDERIAEEKKQINQAAYFNWINAGCPWGRAEEFWYMAERQINGGTEEELNDIFGCEWDHWDDYDPNSHDEDIAR